VVFKGMRHWLSQETPDNVAAVQAELLGWIEGVLAGGQDVPAAGGGKDASGKAGKAGKAPQAAAAKA
jgi:hypothetical protein